MVISKYRLTIISFAALLLVVIIALATLLYSQGPRVRIVSFERNPSQTSLHKNSTMTIAFDRPLETLNFANQISFSPEVDFSARTSGQSIIVTFNENLQHSTQYTLNIQSAILDKTGQALSEPYSYSFDTGAPFYAYLERNYGFEFEDDVLQDDADDHVKLARLGEEPETIFSAPEITQFAANSQYLVVAVSGEVEDQLFTIDLETREVRQEELLLPGRIDNLAVSPLGAIALFTRTPDFNAVSPEYFAQFSNLVESLNLETGEVITISNADDESIRSFVPIQFDPSGQAALIKDEQQTYYAISPFNDYDPVPLGLRSTSFGFNEDGDEIIFRDGEGFVRYNIETGIAEEFRFDSRGYIQNVDVTQNGIFYSSTRYLLGEASSYVQKIDSWQADGVDLVWSNDNYPDTALSDLSTSKDGSILAAQINPNSCSFDSITTNSKCKEARTVLYDHENREELATFRGFDLIWLP